MRYQHFHGCDPFTARIAFDVSAFDDGCEMFTDYLRFSLDVTTERNNIDKNNDSKSEESLTRKSMLRNCPDIRYTIGLSQNLSTPPR